LSFFRGSISSRKGKLHSLLYTTLGEIIDQRAGIVNLGLEGVLLISGATGIAVTSLTGVPYFGVLAAILAGGITNLILGFLVVTRRGNQLASGLALMFFRAISHTLSIRHSHLSCDSNCNLGLVAALPYPLGARGACSW
jgi:ABC-type uncharacterized transport system permease subunit